MSTHRAHLLPHTDALRAFVAGAPDAMLLLTPGADTVWTIVDCNRAACHLYGVPPDDLVGHAATLLTRSLGAPAADDVFQRTQQAGTQCIEAVHQRPDGARVTLELALTPLTSADHPLIVAVVRDLTSHHRTARRLAAEHAVSRVLAGAGHFMDIADQLLQIIGDQLEWELGALWCVQDDRDVLGCTATWQAPGSPAAGFAAASRALTFARGIGLPGTVWARGSPHWLADLRHATIFARPALAAQAHLRSAFAFPLTGPRSGIFGVMEFFSRDPRSPDTEMLAMAATIGTAVGEYIERRRAETALRASEARQQFLAEASTLLSASLDYDRTLANLVELAVPHIADWCSINLLDEHGELVRVAGRHVDPSKAAILQQLRTTHPPDPTKPLVPPDVAASDRPTLIATVTDAHLQRLAQHEEQLRVYRAMGFRSALLVPLCMNTQLIGLMILATGESGRRYGADDVALAEDLAQRAALAIEHAQLYRQARAAVQLRDAFLSVAAHELKTPVTTLVGYSQLLRRRLDREHTATDRDRRAVQILAAQTERLATLVDSLLDVSRLERGQFTLNGQLVDFGALVARVAAELQTVLPRTEPPHRLDWNVPAGPLLVDGDPLRLEQVVQNLVQNAVKYSPQGGPISLHVAQDAGQAVLMVRDRGIGIPRVAQAHVFERLYRVEQAAARDISGMGIGLYVVDEIVKRHGGTVEVASTEGVGSTFTVRVPLADRTGG